MNDCRNTARNNNNPAWNNHSITHNTKLATERGEETMSQHNDNRNREFNLNNKKTTHRDRMKFNKNNNIRMNSESNSKNNISSIKKNNSSIDNPFSKVIDRHYGSFKCNILGNHKRIFNSLNLVSLKPLGNNNSVKRKILRNENFTAIFYCSKNRGSVELKIPRALQSHKTAVEDLRNQYYQTAIAARTHLEKYFPLTLGIPVQNRLAKYGVEDSTAQRVKLELRGEHRKIDASTRVINGKVVRGRSHVDNFGSVSAKADCRLSDKEHDVLSTEYAKRSGFLDSKSPGFRRKKGEGRLIMPEALGSIEATLFELADAQREGAENIKFFGEHMKAHVKAVQKLAAAADRIAPKRLRFPTSFKKSASVKGCS